MVMGTLSGRMLNTRVLLRFTEIAGRSTMSTESQDAATVCLMSLDMIAFLDRADREGLEHEWNYFCEEGSCTECTIRTACQDIAKYGMYVDRNNPKVNTQARERLEIIFEVNVGLV